ncbi:MAG: internalin, partial [Prevotella sp.]|nr:internalin [Prevotella sp.]
IVDGATIAGVYDGWTTTPVTGKPVGSGEIKIYATGAVTYFDCVSKVDGPGITKLDVSNAAELTELYANGNKLTTFDGSKLAKLTRLELHNNSLTEVNLPSSLTTLKLDNNQLTSFDGSNCTLVTTLYLSNNNLGTLDVSMMPALKSLYALNCGLTSVNAPLKVAKAFISVNNNKLETLDVTEATGLENGSLFAMGNNLTEVKLPNVKVKSVNISNNKFTLATIPATANVTTLTYAPQQEMEIADIDGTIDLSAQNNLTGFATEAKPTVYAWYAEDGTALVAGTDYTEEAGKFTFVKEQAQKVYCTMTTEALPKFTGTNIFKTIAVTVKATATGIENIESDAAMTGDIYSVDGKLIKRGANLTDMQKGLYIIKTAAGKTVKVSK